MSDWLERVQKEHRKLQKKVEKLDDFLSDENNELVTGSDQWKAMQDQLHHMDKYLGVLHHRIKLASAGR